MILKKTPLSKTQVKIIKAVREYSPISRSGLAAQTGLPHAVITRSIASLFDHRFLIESPYADTTGQRRKKTLQLNPEVGCAVGLEYTPNSIQAAVIDFSYQVIFKDTLQIPLGAMKREQKIELLKHALTDLLKHPSVGSRCMGIALVDPGTVDCKNAVALRSTTMEDWANVPIGQLMQSEFALPVRLFNTSQARIRAMDRFETRGTSENLMYVEYGEGIGCGLKLEGQYIRGAGNLAGELGHIQITDDPVACRCGGFGCLEAVAALPAIARKAVESLTPQSSSVLAQKSNLTGDDVLLAAAQGDRLARHIVDAAFDYVAKAAAAVINVVSPEIVLLDPHLKLSGKEALEGLIRNIKKYIVGLHRDTPDIRVSCLDSHIGAIGGAAAIVDLMIDDFSA